jgi:hypothetical protein
VEDYERVLERDKKETKQLILDKEDHYQEKFGRAFSEKRIDLVASWHLLSGMELDGLFQEMVSMIEEIKSFEIGFANKKQVPIRFAEEAVDEILDRAVYQGVSATTICHRVSADYDYALKLIMDKTGQEEFLITKEAIKDPEGYINEQIRRSYGSSHFALRGPSKK